MNSGEIRQLLDKYYNGESTIEEEHALREFFNAPDIPDEFTVEKDIFRYYSVSSQTYEPSTDFAERVISAVDNSTKDENTKQRSLYIKIAGIAAAITILAGSYFFFTQNRGPAETYSDPQIAYAETMKILYDVSDRLNQGTRELDRIKKMKQVAIKSLNTINKTSGTLQEVIKPLNDLPGKIKIERDSRNSNLF